MGLYKQKLKDVYRIVLGKNDIIYIRKKGLNYITLRSFYGFYELEKDHIQIL